MHVRCGEDYRVQNWPVESKSKEKFSSRTRRTVRMCILLRSLIDPIYNPVGEARIKEDGNDFVFNFDAAEIS